MKNQACDLADKQSAQPLRKEKTLSVCVVACEPSGDQLGAAAIKALNKRLRGQCQIWGIGGKQMMSAGNFVSQACLNKLSVGGLGFLSHLSYFVSTFMKMRRLLRRIKPDVLLTFDAPDFTLRLSRWAAPSCVKKVHCVAPSVWAWRPGRAHKVAKFLDHLCTLLPFEPPYFSAHGLSATFVGHPMIENLALAKDHKTLPLSIQGPFFLLMPGSRVQEIDTFLGTFLAVASKTQALSPCSKVVLLTLSHLKDCVQKHLRSALIKVEVVVADDLHERFAWMRAARAALVASGTSTLELGLAECPMVVAYKVSRPFSWILRRLLKTPFVALPNVLLDQEVVPECLQERCRVDVLWMALKPLLSEESARLIQKKRLAHLKGLLMAQQYFGDSVAEVVLECAQKKAL